MDIYRGQCSVEGCEKPLKRGRTDMCSMHTARVYRHGSPHVKYKAGGKPRPFRETFELYVDFSNPRSCWEWNGYRDKSGYGRVQFEGGPKFAHRVVYQNIKKLRLTPDQILCHTCDNPPCVNPGHLFVGTHADNARDCFKKGRTPRGEKHRAAKLTAPEVMEARRLHLLGEATANQLAERYGIAGNSMRQALRGTTWKHLPQPDIEVGEAA